ncbi:transposase [Streptomyces sp. CHD11]|nr:transposase [Streptomyces sp. CHD11]
MSTEPRIRPAHHEPDGTCGVPRITAEPREDDEQVNHKRIAHVMRSIGLAGMADAAPRRLSRSV